MDITQLILDDHQEQRRLFGILEQIERTNTSALSAIWKRLATFLEVHAKAEEVVFYPALLRVGQGVGDTDGPEDETLDAIKDHNEIRDAVAHVAQFPAGTDAWYQAVADANEANSDHMAEEEREGMTDFRQHAHLQTSHKLAIQFAYFEAAHVTGVHAVSEDPESYINEAQRQS